MSEQSKQGRGGLTPCAITRRRFLGFAGGG